MVVDGRGEELEKVATEAAMVAWVKRRTEENGSQLARDLGVGQSTISRWYLSGATELTERLREQVVAFWEERGIVAAEVEAEPGPQVDDVTEGTVNDDTVNDDTVNGDTVHVITDAEVDGPSPPVGSETLVSEDRTPQRVSDVEGDKTKAPIPLSVIPRVERATTSEEIASEMGVPVLALLDVAVARATAQELAAGWQWKGGAALPGVHGDVLLYMHTRERVNFRDEGARTVAFTPNEHRFACGLSAAEMRFGIAPRLRQEPYAVREHWKRPLLIGTRLAGLIPAVRYEDEDWFFGSCGRTRRGEVCPSAAELVARRRVLQEMAASFDGPPSGLGSRLWLVASIELLEVEATLLGPDYELTFGEQVIGNRTWPPSTRLGIETDWRVAEIERLETRLFPGVAGGLLRGLSGSCRFVWTLVLFLPGYAARSVARSQLRRRGAWDTIFDSPYRRAAVVVRSGRRPSRLSIWGYRLLRRLAGVSILFGQVCGARDWQAEAPPWSEAFQRRFRRERIPVDYKPAWRPYEFDEGYSFLPRGEAKAPKPRHRRKFRVRRLMDAIFRWGASMRLPTPLARLPVISKLARMRPVDASVENRDGRPGQQV